ncbi:SLAP domain-containing protein [Tumebacillus flagellatus]|uniref:SLAP domain-containing protein n=1 Tax=Tumebacillus flagellatus TaxID=1157490 RepID=A0A074MDW7_9BACL|nr:SLAP domain-containing protein [Tumebacillus flagellatus]KEO84027.1 hypothetical protein EL26_06055 [Tumebacillus flagellatus]
MENKRNSFMERLLAKRKEAEQLETEQPVDESSIPTTATLIKGMHLAFTEGQEEQMNAIEKDRYREILTQMPPLLIGEVNIVPFEAGELNGGYFVRVFIRNGRELGEEISLEELRMYLLDKNGERVASGIFQLEDFGFLKFGEARLWTFAWHASQVLKPNADLSQFNIEIV